MHSQNNNNTLILHLSNLGTPNLSGGLFFTTVSYNGELDDLTFLMALQLYTLPTGFPHHSRCLENDIYPPFSPFS